ncbi:MAG: ABC transporter permease, partial [Gammaproteobacteria bacterium]|nr:ABC transporter permease [Gammaproteobacteria bacterium]
MGDYLRQTWAVAVWNVRTLGSRLHATAVILVGFMAVVLVFVSVLSIRAGFEATMARTGSDDVAIVRGNVTDTLDGNMAAVIARAPGVAQGPDGPL